MLSSSPTPPSDNCSPRASSALQTQGRPRARTTLLHARNQNQRVPQSKTKVKTTINQGHPLSPNRSYKCDIFHNEGRTEATMELHQMQSSSLQFPLSSNRSIPLCSPDIKCSHKADSGAQHIFLLHQFEFQRFALKGQAT